MQTSVHSPTSQPLLLTQYRPSLQRHRHLPHLPRRRRQLSKLPRRPAETQDVETVANVGLLIPRHGRSANRYVSQRRLLRSTTYHTTLQNAMSRLCHGKPTFDATNNVSQERLVRLHICRQRTGHCTTTLTTCNSRRASGHTAYDSTLSMVTLLVHPQETSLMSHCVPRHTLLDSQTESPDDGCTTRVLLDAQSDGSTSHKTNGRPRQCSTHQ